jgi:hypothetical protein
MMAARQIEARKFRANLGMACEDATDILQPAEGVFNLVSFPTCLLAETERQLATGLVRADRSAIAFAQPPSLLHAVASLVGQESFHRLTATNERLGHRTIMCRPIGQHQGNKAACSIRDRRDLRVASVM